jgi:hypothetical protein
VDSSALVNVVARKMIPDLPGTEHHLVRFQVLTAPRMKVTVFWNLLRVVL